MCLHWNGFWTLGSARSAKAERRHKSGASASRYANDGQNCGSVKHGAIHKVLYLIKKLGNKPFGLFPSSSDTKAIDIVPVVEAAKGTNIQVGAENMYFEEKGAYTG